MIKTLWLSLSTVLLFLSSLQTAHALVKFDQPREFILDKSCEAYRSIRKKTEAEPLNSGQRVTAIAENRQPNPTHTLLQLGSQQKWLDLECGDYSGNVATPPAPTASDSCLPFFDNEDNPIRVKVGGLADITPPAPQVTAFGNAVNAVCGPAGKQVSRDEFKTLLRNHPELLARLRVYTSDKVFADRPARQDQESYLNDLTDAWFNVHAFDHIFCGEPKSGSSIGGLHFVGRYLQLQQSGEACRMDNARQNEVVPGVIYSMGVIMQTRNGGLARSSIKGYGLTLNAEDILQSVTRAFAENPGSSANESKACLLTINDDGQQFVNVFVRRKTGIRTFYPDATPRGEACAQALSLESRGR